MTGDFTGNGRADLAVANYSDDDVSILLGNGDGTFQNQVTYPVGSSPDAIVAADLNGDGHPDLAVANSYDNDVSILMGNGDGTFQNQVTYAVGSNPDALVTGDFNGNGRTDLAVANSDDNDVSILMGNGDGTFQNQVTYAVGSSPVALVTGDFNGDGRTDLAVANQDSNDVSILLGNGDGTFQNQVTYAVGAGPLALVAGDFNGDGRTDLAVANSGSNDVSILLGNGDGTFQNQVTYAVGSSPVAIVAGDFNGDGRTDLAVVNYNDVSILLGNGDGTFQNQVIDAVGSFPVAIVAGDFNGDGRTDLAVVNSLSNDVSILMGNGDGTFQNQVTYAVGSSPDAIVAGDFSGDGRTDLAVANSGDNDVSILMGNGDGTFQNQVTYAVGSAPYALVTGDFNGDGRTDLAVANNGDNDVSILIGNGDGTFQNQVTYAVGSSPDAIVSGDFNGDGRTDLAVANEASNNISILMGNGDGTFQNQVTYDVGSSPTAIVTGDFNGDGRADLAIANYNSSNESILLGNGDGTFQNQLTDAVGSSPYAVVTGDFNGDGRTDLAVANRDSNDVSILLGNGDGTFADPSQFATAPHATPLVADLSGDGTDDVLVVDGSGNILYRQGVPGQPGSFLPPVTINPGYPSRDIALITTPAGPVVASVDAQDDAVSLYAWRDGGFLRIGSLTTGQLPAQIISADLDGNGFDDLVVRNAGDGTLSVFFGTNFIGPVNPASIPVSFLAPVTLPVGLGVSDVQTIDTMRDGRLDLVVTNKLTGQVSVLRNLGNGTFAPPEPYRAGTGLSEIDLGGIPEVTSLEATAGVAAGPLTLGGPASFVTINPGSNTLDVLAGLGGARFANAVTIQTASPAQVVRMGDFTGNGINDLAVLTSGGVSIYLGNGHGGFLPPTSYAVGPDSDGLTIADLLGNGQLDLLVGNAYGDVLILVGNGDGTFRPFEPVKTAIALAVADLTGNGALDFIFADQSLNQVTVVYGTTSQNSTSAQVIANQASGLLAPGAVKLADLNEDGIPDLIVANSGGNNVLVYPGLGNGQFGPPINGTAGFPVGTDPTGLTVANLNGQPDLLVADTGSNDVSVLLGQGSGSSWTLVPGPRIQTDAGPVATVVGNLLGGNQLDLAVANSGADNVQVFPSVGGGFFNDQPQATKTYSVGQDPAALFLGNFSGLGLGLATLNAGSDNGSLISNPGSANPVIQSFATGGNSPITGFAGDFSGTGYTDLVVGNNGDGRLALLLGGTGGLSLSQSLFSPAAPNPTAVSFGGVSDGVLSFYVSTAGREAALQMTFDLDGEGAILGPGSVPSIGPSPAPGVTVVEVAQLGHSGGSVLNLIATLVTLTVVPGNLESELESAGGGTALLAAFSPGGATGLGQSLLSPGQGNDDGGGEPELKNPADPTTAGQANAPVDRLAPWARFAVGLDEGWQELRARLVGGERVPTAGEDGKSSGSPRVETQAPSSLAPSQADPSRSETKSHSGSRGGDDSPFPDTSHAPAGATSSGAWRNRPRAGVNVSTRTRFSPVPAAVDSALEELGESMCRSNRLFRIAPPVADDRSDSPASLFMQIAAGSMALSMTRERSIVAGRGRRDARRVPRLRGTDH